MVRNEPLQKRSKNVRVRTRNLSLAQIHDRLEQYTNRVGFKVGRTHSNTPAKTVRDVLQPAIQQPLSHELAHALMTPEGETANQYTSRLYRWGKQPEFTRYGELNENRVQANRDEDVANVMEPGIARRAGVAPKLVASKFSPNPYNNPSYSLGEVTDDLDAYEHHEGLLDEARYHLNQVDSGLKTFKRGRALPGTSIDAKINERAMKKNDETANRVVPPQWLGRPIVHQDHVTDLETRAAMNEFHHKMPRAEAEQHAHDAYVQEQQERAAAHHLAGMKAAMSTGNYEDARKHWALYDLHLNALGKNAIGAVPPEIEKRMMESDKPVYKFKSHKGDLYALHSPSVDQAPPAGRPLHGPQNIHGQELPVDSSGWPAGVESWGNKVSKSETEPYEFVIWSRAQHQGHKVDKEQKPQDYHHGQAWERHKAGDHSHCTKAATMTGACASIKKAQVQPGALQTEVQSPALRDVPSKGDPSSLQNMQELVAEDGEACAACSKPLASGSVMLSQDQDPYFPRFCGPDCAMKGGKSEAQKFFEGMEQPISTPQKHAGATAESPIQGDFAPLRSSELAKGDVIRFPGNPNPAEDRGTEAKFVDLPGQRGATVHSSEGVQKKVKNLGWLLRNAGNVKHFELTTKPTGSGHMIAHLHDGGRYEIPWASHIMMRSWLNRPVFRGATANVDGHQYTVGPDVANIDPIFKSEAKQCKWRLGERRCRRVVKADYCHDHVDHWANKIRQQDHDGLAKAVIPPAGTGHLTPPPLHNTFEGFMNGLKAIPKGSPERGKFITQHMNHAPFQAMLQKHPQGTQIRTMLNQHLNAAGNAGFKPGATQTIVKAEAVEMATQLLKALQDLLKGSMISKV